MLSFAVQAQETQLQREQWKTPLPVFKQDFDWLKLTSDEWVKGDIIAMYDGTLEFDSDNMGIIEFDWEDVAELRSKDVQSIRMEDGEIVEGYIVIKNGKLQVVNESKTHELELASLLSIASSSANEWDLWDGDINLGLDFADGNVEQFNYNFSAGAQRRTSTSRFKANFTANYSENKDQDTGETKATADSQRFTSFYDWFFSQKVFFRVVDFEYYSDEFQNIDYRATLGVSLGYTLIDNAEMTWDVTAGPSYQTTKFFDVADDTESDETSAALSLGTLFEYEITSDIDYDFKYQVLIVSEEAGKYIHHIETGLDMDLVSDFELGLTFYVDRIDNPRQNADGSYPEQNDYRMVVSLGYEF